jgi:hypothetical protein
MKFLRPLSTLCLCASMGAAAFAEAPGLEAGFAAPPSAVRPQVWWQWMDGNVSRAGITADLEAMKKVGVAGATIVNLSFGIPDGPIRFNSPAWTEMTRFAASEADRLGLALGIENAAGWSSTGGPWNTPEHSMQVVVWSETAVKGADHFNGKLPQPPSKMNYYQDIAVLAFPTPAHKLTIENLPGKSAVVRQPGLIPPAPVPVPADSAVAADKIVDLTAEMKPDGTLEWSPPGGGDGDWTILRIGHTTTGSVNEPSPKEGKGLEVDKLSREALKLHWAGMLGKLQTDLGPLMGQGKGITSTLIDSYERGDQNWTPKFKEEFQRLRGYDLSPYLPVFAGWVVESPEKSERFLWDVRRTVADLFTENQYDYFGELGKQAGLKTMLEPYGDGGFEDLMCGRNIDEIMGEFWVGWPGIEGTVKIASSSAHIYGKRVVGAESLTSTGPNAANPTHGRWQGTPYIYKQYIDRAFGLGLNHLVFHRFAHQPWPDRFPGMTMGPFGSHIDRTNTWWDKSADWMTYLGRCSYLLQQGHPVADLLWFDGETAPSSTPDTWGLPPGYDFDGCTADVIMSRLKVADHRIVLPDGTSYRALILPNSGGDTMTPALIAKIKELADAGASIAAGPKPTRSPSLAGYPGCDAEVKKIAADLWDHNKIIAGKSPADIVKALDLAPDFESKNKVSRLVYVHRRLEAGDLYFVANQKGIFQASDCLFRVTGKTPELWHPDTGEIEPAPAYAEENGRTCVPLPFEPYGSVFVFFRDQEPAGRHAVAVAEPAPESPVENKLTIKKAVYEGMDGGGSLDVTEKVAAMVRDGTLSIMAANITFSYKDICPGHVGHLVVDYVFNGTPGRKVIVQSDWMDIQDPTLDTKLPAYRLHQAAKGDLTLETWQSGTYSVQMSEGDPVAVKSDVPAPVEVAGGWDLQFPPNWGAPEKASFDKLISWSDFPDAGVKYFSGTAKYVKTLDVPANLLGAGKRLYLDLGTVKEIAQVKLNGKDLGVMWKKPFMAEITGAAKAGPNQLEVEVTNLWPNRLIGDEQLPPDSEIDGDHIKKWPQWLLDGKPSPTGRFTFTTWHFWKKDEPLLESGLIGPVLLRPSVEQAVR